MSANPIAQLLNRIPSQLYLVCFLLAVIVISYLAFSPTKDQPPLFLFSDKLNHIVAFFTLMLLIDYGRPKQKTIVKLSIVLGYGVFIELVQAQLPYRDFSLLDFLADSLGCFIYFGFARIIGKPN